MGTAKRLTFAGVKGDYWLDLEEQTQATWVPSVASMFTTDQPQEDYPWLGDAPKLQKWQGERSRQQLRDFGFTIVNDVFDSGIGIPLDDWRRDKTDQVMARINELAGKVAHLPQRILTELLEANGNAFDGTAFFDNSRTIGDSGTIDNIVGTGDGAAGGASPTSAQQVTNILLGVQRMMGFKDDQGDPRNETARSFLVMVPVNLWSATVAALQDEFTSAGGSNTLRNAALSIVPAINARLTVTTRFYVFRTDARIRAMIWQDETQDFDMLGQDSEHAFKYREIWAGATRLGAGGYGRPELAVQVNTA